MFLGILAGVLVVCGWVGWQIYNQPVDPKGAEIAATRATEITIMSAGGDPSACEDMALLSTSDGVVERCRQAASGEFGSMGSFTARGLRVEETDLDRNSGSVTIVVGIASPMPAPDVAFTWQLTHTAGAWKVAAAPDVSLS